MTTLEFQGNWNAIRKKLRQKHPDLTDDDLRYEEGRESQLLDHLQKTLCMTEEEILQEIDCL
jgi:uncharacterized protein YjbJ (UPF0337 family)